MRCHGAPHRRIVSRVEATRLARRLLLACLPILTANLSQAQDRPAEHEHEAHHAAPASSDRGAAPEAPAVQGSGTSWLPGSSPMYAHHFERGAWMGMLHYNLFAGVSTQSSRRSLTEAWSTSWIMGTAQRPIPGGELTLRAMLSLEPLLLKREGYPLLLQTGESAHGKPLVDRQHPHDLFMELAGIFQRPLLPGYTMEIYVAAAGEPAMGPPAFPHRPSAMADPLAPLSHHWLDATHISFGVLTLGVATQQWKLDGSWFNGREPDEHRTDIDLHALESYSTRVTWNPTPHWSLQVSLADLKEPEELEPGKDVLRTTASASMSLPAGRGRIDSMLAWGRNDAEDERAGHAVLLESAYTIGPHAIFGRAEYVEKSGHDFDQEGERARNLLPVGGVSLGYSRAVARAGGAAVVLGARGSLGFVGETLERERYGDSIVRSGSLFLQLRPAETGGHEQGHGRMHGM